MTTVLFTIPMIGYVTSDIKFNKQLLLEMDEKTIKTNIVTCHRQARDWNECELEEPLVGDSQFNYSQWKSIFQYELARRTNDLIESKLEELKAKREEISPKYAIARLTKEIVELEKQLFATKSKSV